MAWAVDTCLLIDVAEADPAFHVRSAALIDSKRAEGIRICPVSFVELGPVFEGNLAAQIEFLANLGIPWPENWTDTHTKEAFVAWNNYVEFKRAGKVPKRPIADILIGSFAQTQGGLLTRNGSDFMVYFPNLTIVQP